MAPRSTTETFFFFGDSLTLGVNDNAMPGGWVSRLVLLGSQAGWYDMPPATFYNLGVRRHTSPDIAARWQAEVASRQIPGLLPGRGGHVPCPDAAGGRGLRHGHADAGSGLGPGSGLAYLPASC